MLFSVHLLLVSAFIAVEARIPEDAIAVDLEDSVIHVEFAPLCGQIEACTAGCYSVVVKGCPACQCNTDLCQLVQCPPGFTCGPSNVRCFTKPCPLVNCIRDEICPDIQCNDGCYLEYPVDKGCPVCKCNKDYDYCEVSTCPPGSRYETTIIPCAKEKCTISKCVRRNATCHCSGDPHCITFDGAGYWDYQGTCEYILTQAVNFQPAFAVYSKNQFLNGYTQVSYVQYVRVTIGGDNIHMERTASYSSIIAVKVNNIQVVLPYNAINYVVEQFYGLVRLTTNFGLIAEYTTFFSLNIILSPSLRNHVEGYCGNYNDNPADDSTDRTGKFWPNIGQSTGAVLGASWVTTVDEKCYLQPPQLPVTPIPVKCPLVKERCRQINNINGIFRDCINIITLSVATKLAESCVYDADATCSDQVVCAAMEAFVQKCQAVGVVVAWREATRCPCTCSDPNAVCSSGKVSACPATCSDPQQTRPCYEAQLMDACICKPGFVLSGGSCVAKDQCFCVDATGKHRNIGEQWLNGDCSSMSTCNSAGDGGISNKDFKCPSKTACMGGICHEPCATKKCPLWQVCQIQCMNPLCQPATAKCVYYLFGFAIDPIFDFSVK